MGSASWGTGVPKAQPPCLPFMPWPEIITEKHSEVVLSQPCVCYVHKLKLQSAEIS